METAVGAECDVKVEVATVYALETAVRKVCSCASYKCCRGGSM